MKNVITVARTVWLEQLRRKDFYIVLMLLVFLSGTMTSINAFGSRIPATYILDIGLMLAFVLSAVLAITTATRQLPAEEHSGTIFTMLIKPVGRFEFLFGKWIGIWSGLAAANALFYLAVAGITLTRGTVFEPAVLLQAFALHCILLGLIAAAGLFFGVFMSFGASAALTAVFIALAYGMVPQIPHLLTETQGWRGAALYGLYFLMPHLELFDMRSRVLHNWGTLPLPVFLGTVGYGLLCSAVFLLAGWCIFRNRRFKRGRYA